MRNQLKDNILDRLQARDTGIKNYFNIEFVNKILDQFYKGEYERNTGLIWALFLFEIWYKSYIEKRELSPPVL